MDSCAPFSETQGPSTALQIHFVNPQGSAQDDNVRTKVRRFGSTRSLDCAADSLREPAGSAQDDNVRTKVHRFRKHKVLRLRLPIHFVNPQGSAQDDNVRTKVHRFGNTRSFDCAADSLREPAGLRSG